MRCGAEPQFNCGRSGKRGGTWALASCVGPFRLAGWDESHPWGTTARHQAASGSLAEPWGQPRDGRRLGTVILSKWIEMRNTQPDFHTQRAQHE